MSTNIDNDNAAEIIDYGDIYQDLDLEGDIEKMLYTDEQIALRDAACTRANGAGELTRPPAQFPTRASGLLPLPPQFTHQPVFADHSLVGDYLTVVTTPKLKAYGKKAPSITPANKILNDIEAGPKSCGNQSVYLARTVKVSSPQEIERLLRSLQADQALIPGWVPGTENGEVFQLYAEKKLSAALGVEKDTYPLGIFIDKKGIQVCGRFKDNFQYSSWRCFDLDAKDEMPKELLCDTTEDFRDLIAKIEPGIEKTALVAVPSTKNRIVHDETGEAPWRSGSMHIWVKVTTSPELWADVLKWRALGVGLGWQKPVYSRSGANAGQQIRAIDEPFFDPAPMKRMSGLVFDGPPIVEVEGYSVIDPDITVSGGGAWDTSKIAPLEEHEIRKVEERTGVKITSNGKGRVSATIAELTLETELITKKGIKTLQALLDEHRASGKKQMHVHCQADWRGSTSWNAYVGLHQDGSPFVYDNGKSTKYVLAINPAVDFGVVDYTQSSNPQAPPGLLPFDEALERVRQGRENGEPDEKAFQTCLQHILDATTMQAAAYKDRLIEAAGIGKRDYNNALRERRTRIAQRQAAVRQETQERQLADTGPGGIILLPGDLTPYTEAGPPIFQCIAETLTMFRRGGRVHEWDSAEKRLELVSREMFVTRIDNYGSTMLKVDGRNGPELEPRRCPPATAQALLESEFIDALPSIRGVYNRPVLTADGEILHEGYHPVDGGVLVLHEGPPIPAVPVGEAVEALRDLLADFDFVEKGDLARALAGMVSPAMVNAGIFRGPPVIDLAEADKSQSGKTYRQELVREIYGEEAYVVPQRDRGVGSIDESIAAGVRTGRAFVALDNFRGSFSSPMLEQILTWDGLVTTRIPYKGEVEVDARRINFQISSNGLKSSPDLANRASIIRILKRPGGYTYRTWPEGDVKDHIRAHQPYYLGCVYALVKAWMQEGRPGVRCDHDRRYWAEPLNWISCELFKTGDLMAGHKAARERQSDPGLKWLRELAQHLAEMREIRDGYTALELAALSIDTGIMPTLNGEAHRNDDRVLARRIGVLISNAFNRGEIVQEGVDDEECEYQVLTIDRVRFARMQERHPFDVYTDDNQRRVFKKRWLYAFCIANAAA